MGNIHSDTNNQPASAAADTATDEYDPNGAVIPDINILEIFNLEKLERCLTCVPLNLDQQSPTSHARDSVGDAGATGNGQSFGGDKSVDKTRNNNKGGDDVDILSTITEGEEDENVSGLDKAVCSPSSNGSSKEFNPDKIAQGEDHDSVDFTEFDPDAMIPTATNNMVARKWQQQQTVLNNKLDDVLKMRSSDQYDYDNDDSFGEMYNDDDFNDGETDTKTLSHEDAEPQRYLSTNPSDEPSEQQIFKLLNPIDVAQRRVCNAIRPKNMKNLNERHLFINEKQHDGDIDEEYVDNGNNMSMVWDWDNYQQRETKEVDEKKEGSESGPWRVNLRVTENDKNQIERRDDNPAGVADDANKNSYFDNIISDFELLGPRQTKSKKAYSSVRSWKSQRAHKQRRNNIRNNRAHGDDENCKTLSSPKISDAAFSFAEETAVGRKLNGISPASSSLKFAFAEKPEVLPNDEVDKISAPLGAAVTSTEQNQDNDCSSYPNEGVIDMGDHDTDESDAEMGANTNINVSYSCSAEEFVQESTDDTGKDQSEQPNEIDLIKIKYNLSGESTVDSSTFEATHARLKGLMSKTSYESDSVNDSVNWDNLAYSMSHESPVNTRNEYLVLRPTPKDTEDKINQMKKQREDEKKSFEKELHDITRDHMYTAVQRRIDAVREQINKNNNNMRAVLKETDDNRNPLSPRRDNREFTLNESSRLFVSDEEVKGTRQKSQELMKQNAKIEEEMKKLRDLSPRSTDSPTIIKPKTSRGNISNRRYSSTVGNGSPAALSSPCDASLASEAKEALSSMILDANEENENMNIRLTGMIADIKAFLQENDKVQERLSDVIM